MSSIVLVRKIQVEDFISLDHDNSEVSLTIFHGRAQPGAPGWANGMTMPPATAENLARELIDHAKAVRKSGKAG